MIALFGAIGPFEPIRVPDAPKATWEALHSRNDLLVFGNRSKVLSDLLSAQVALPPGVEESGDKKKK